MKYVVFSIIALVAFVTIPLASSIDNKLLINSNRYSTESHTIAFSHRSNSFEKARVIDVLNRKYKNISGEGAILLGMEVDINYYNKRIVVVHDSNKEGIELSDFLSNIPTYIPIFLDVKDSLDNKSALKILLSIIKLNSKRYIVVGSLNGNLLSKMHKSGFTNLCFISWLLSPPKYTNYKYRIFEYYSRLFGYMGGGINNPISIDSIGYNWKQLLNKDTLSKEFNMNRVAGNVDTKESLKQILSLGVNILTDSPEMINQWYLELKI